MASLYRHARACLSASKAEAGMAVLQEGFGCGKPVLCSDIPAAREHAALLRAKVGFFEPDEPEQLADRISELEAIFSCYEEAARQTRQRVLVFNEDYMGLCFHDVMMYAAG